MVDKNYLIQDIRIDNSQIIFEAGSDFQKYYLKEDFFVIYEDEIDLTRIGQSILAIPFILNVAPIVWLSGKTYYVSVLDSDLAASLETLRLGFKEMYPNLTWNGKIIVDSPIDNNVIETSDEKKLGVLFSGGLDSIFTSIANIEHKQHLISVLGTPEVLLNQTEKCRNVEAQLRLFAKTYNHSISIIKSNLTRFINPATTDYLFSYSSDWWGYFQHGLGLLGLTAPLLSYKGCKKVLIASTFTNEYNTGWGSDPRLDNNIKWNGITVEHHGYESSRQDKIKAIISKCIDHNLQKPYLRVCWNYSTLGENCCKCEKCLRTIAGLLVEDQNINEYGFNISNIKVTKLIIEAFQKTKMSFSEDQLFMWEDIKKRAIEITKNIKNNENKEFLEWLINFDFAIYKERYEQKKHYRKSIKKFLMKYHIIYPIVRSVYKKTRRTVFKNSLGK